MTDVFLYFLATLPISIALFSVLMHQNKLFYAKLAYKMTNCGRLYHVEKMLSLEFSTNLDFEGETKQYTEEINQKLNGNVKALIPRRDGYVYDYCSFELALALDTHSVQDCYWLDQVKGTDLQDGNKTFVYQTEMREYMYDYFSTLAMLDMGERPIPAVFSRWIDLINPWRDDASLVDTIVLLFVWRRINWKSSSTCKAVAHLFDLHGEDIFSLNAWMDLIHDRWQAEKQSGSLTGKWRWRQKGRNVDLCDCSSITMETTSNMLKYLSSIRPQNSAENHD